MTAETRSRGRGMQIPSEVGTGTLQQDPPDPEPYLPTTRFPSLPRTSAPEKSSGLDLSLLTAPGDSPPPSGIFSRTVNYFEIPEEQR